MKYFLNILILVFICSMVAQINFVDASEGSVLKLVEIAT